MLFLANQGHLQTVQTRVLNCDPRAFRPKNLLRCTWLPPFIQLQDLLPSKDQYREWCTQESVPSMQSVSRDIWLNSHKSSLKKKKSYFCSFCKSRSEKPQMHFSLQPWWDRYCCPARTCSSRSPTNSVKSFCQEPLAEGTELNFFQPTAWPQSNLSFCHGDSFIYLKSHISLEHTHPHLHEFSLTGLSSHCST